VNCARISKLLVCSYCLAATLFLNPASGEITAAQRKQIEQLNDSVTQAARLFVEGRFTESSEIVRRVQSECETLAGGGDPQVLAALESIHGRLSKAHALLELEGIDLPPLKPLGAGSIPGEKPAATPSDAGSQVSFSADLAPMFAEQCGNCHGRGRQPSGRYNLMTFTGLMKGGDTGAGVVPGRPDDSLLVQKLKGTADGQRMPMRAPPLADEVIARVETWIREGARFDGPDPDQNLEQVASLAKSQRSTHEQLSAERKELALKNWSLGMPGQQMDQTESENFFAVGNVGPATLQTTVEAAEALVPKVAGWFGTTVDGPLVKGRITLVVLAQRFEYTEYGKMVERRDVPQSSRGHWRYNVVDAYAVVVLPRADEFSRDALLAQQIAGVYVASLGNVPPWFAEGAARWVASRAATGDARVKAWEAEIPDVVKSLSQPDDFLTGKLAQQQAEAAAFSYVQLLASDAARFRRLLKAVQDGGEFETAFRNAYGGTPSDVAKIWVQQVVRRSAAAGRAR
jgi:hypothetical protein